MKRVFLILIALPVVFSPKAEAQVKQYQKLHIIIIGAHPDDPDKVGGTAYKWAQMGNDVLMVSVTNGDAGHQNPMFLFMSDGFIHPEPFKADVCIDIDDVIEKKIDMYHQHKSQMYEWLPYNRGRLDQVPVSDSDRRIWLGETRKGGSNAAPYRDKLIELYGNEKGSKIKYRESFQDSGYGTRLTKGNISYYFPFLITEKQ